MLALTQREMGSWYHVIVLAILSRVYGLMVVGRRLMPILIPLNLTTSKI